MQHKVIELIISMHITSSLALHVVLVVASSAFVPPSSVTTNKFSDVCVTHHPSSSTVAIHARKKTNEDGGAEDISKPQPINPAKKAALDGVLQRIERNYGRGSIVMLGDADRMKVDCIGSGSMTLGECIVYL